MDDQRPTDDDIRSEYIAATGTSRKQANKTPISKMVEALAEMGVEWAMVEMHSRQN